MHQPSPNVPTDRIARPVVPNDAILRDHGRWLTADRFLFGLSGGSAILILLMLAALIWLLCDAAMPSVRAFGWAFLTGTDWQPNEIVIERPVRGPDGRFIIEDGELVKEVVERRPPSFGALPVIYGTAASSAFALVFAVPLSIGAALFLVRIAPRGLAAVVSFLIEFLAAIPSIAYGIWGLFVMTPFLQKTVEPTIQKLLGGLPFLQWMFQTTVTVGGQEVSRPLAMTGRDLLAGGLILGIMILPIITAVSRDVLRAVPRSQIEASLALGATWWQSCRGMLRYARAGLFGAVMLGLARAAGETMAVTMVIGNNNQINASPFAPAQTMASLLANEFAEADAGLHRAALVHVAMVLLAMSLLFNVVARWLVVSRKSSRIS